MSSQNCPACGKPLGMGTLLDQFPDPPPPRSSVHRLYLLADSDFSEFPSSESQAQPIDLEAWTNFASKHSCIKCAEFLDNEGARYGFE